MADPLRHRQTKGAATDMVDLTPPRHIPTLPQAAVPDKSVIQNKPWSKEAGAARSFRGRSDQ
jgi:hypothetical protein